MAEGSAAKAVPAQPRVTGESRVEFRELTIHREGDGDPLLGCKEVRRFLEIDDDTVQAIEAIRATDTLAQAEADLLARTGEEYDLVELVEYLLERGFVSAIDGVAVPSKAADARKSHAWLSKIPPEKLTWLRHNVFWAALAGVTASWLLVAFLVPEARPDYRSLFFLGRPSLILISSFTISMLLTYGHELAHFLVARSYGVESTISISHRFYMLVMITDVTNAWVLPRPAKLKIFLAGVMYNLTLLSLFGLVTAGILTGVLPLPLALVAPLKFLAFLNLFPIIFQFFFYARTDFYYALMVLMNERNLAKDSLNFLKFRAMRLWRAIRRDPTVPCEPCGRSVQPDDPFCFACGATREVADVNRWPFRYKARRTLLASGVVILVGQAWGYSKFFTVGLRAQLGFVRIGFHFLADAIARRNALAILEGELMFFVILLQALFVTWFLGSSIYRSIATPVRRLLARRAARRAAEVPQVVTR